MRELVLGLKEGEQGLSRDDMKFGELKEHEGVRLPGRRGASKVGVVVGVGE